MNKDSRAILILLKLDAKNLANRILQRSEEYISTLFLKRKRDHFIAIFDSRYQTISIDDLKMMSEELLIAIDHFYTNVEKLKWYLNHTEEMSAGVRSTVENAKKDIRATYDVLNLYIDAELGYKLDGKEDEAKVGNNL
jgi:hypothetical protein